MLGRGKNSFNIKDYKNARDVALFVLLEITENSRKSNAILKETFEEAAAAGAGLSLLDRAFVERIVIGSLDRMITLDTVLGRFLTKPLKNLKPLIRGILRMSVYQLLYMDKVPASAVCNEGVNLARLHGMDGMSGVVNGVLRAVARECEAGGEKVTRFDNDSEKYSLPQWICDLLKEEYGEERAEGIFQAFLAERRDTLRFNLSVLTAEGLEKQEAEAKIVKSLEEDGFSLVRMDLAAMLEAEGQPLPAGELPVMYELSGGGDISGAGAFRKGWVTVQDPAAAVSVSFAAPREKDFVIDVCAAPGGKSLAAAELMHGLGRIEARDISEHKTALIKENVRRCGFGNIEVRVLDALKEDEDSFYRADVLIADLPCSGLGVIAKKPDIKLNLQSYAIEELQELQRDILNNVGRYVKPKGKLLYSTCTLSRAENEENVAWMEQYLGFKTEAVCKLLPGKDHDGFFIAVLKKRY